MNSIPPITRNLIILNVGLFIASFFLPYLYEILPAHFPLSENFKSWQIITHMFMHGGLTHILFNMLTLWSFGPVLEYYLKGKRFTMLYFFSGLGGFLLYNMYYFTELYTYIELAQKTNIQWEDIQLIISGETPSNALIESLKNNEETRTMIQKITSLFNTRMLGASGAIFGVIAAFATLFPNSKITLLFIPFPIKIKFLFPIIILGSVILALTDTMSNIAHFAHIGGAIVGFILAKIWGKKINPFKI